MTDSVPYPTSLHNAQRNNGSKDTITLKNKYADNTSLTTENEDTCGLYGVEVAPNSGPLNWPNRGILKYGGRPCYWDKATVASRLKTYQHWPKSMKQRPTELADAGFFYTGYGDKTICFYCGGGLQDWMDVDDPWEQHALWFSECEFVNLKKGPEFVAKVKAQLRPEDYCANNAPPTETNTSATVDVARSEESEKISLEAHRSEKQTLCKICFTNDLGVVFLPCGHLVACVDCAPALTKCAVCRKPVENMVRAFIS